MAKSVKQVSDVTIKKFFDEMEVGNYKRSDISNLEELPAVSFFILQCAEVFLEKANEILNRQGKINKGTLSSELEVSELTTDANGISISIGYPENGKAILYYDYVNKGVKGNESGEPASSPYAFKKTLPSQRMSSAILNWLQTNRRLSLRETQTKKLSATQRKRKRVTKIYNKAENKKSLAYAVAIGIKRKGIKRSGYFDDAKKYAFGTAFKKELVRIIGTDVKIKIRESNGYYDK